VDTRLQRIYDKLGVSGRQRLDTVLRRSPAARFGATPTAPLGTARVLTASGADIEWRVLITARPATGMVGSSGTARVPDEPEERP
jgi:hypothetical protein